MSNDPGLVGFTGGPVPWGSVPQLAATPLAPPAVLPPPPPLPLAEAPTPPPPLPLAEVPPPPATALPLPPATALPLPPATALPLPPTTALPTFPPGPEGVVPLAPAPADLPTGPPPAPMVWSYGPSRRKRPSGKALLVALGSVLAVVVVAIAGSALLSEEAPAPVTTVSMPETIAFLPRVHGALARELEDGIRPFDTPGTPVVGVFSDYTDSETIDYTIAIGVVATKHRLAPALQADYLERSERHRLKYASTLRFRDVDPGPLGGTLRCSGVLRGAVFCFFVDDEAFGSIEILQVRPATAAELAELAREVRAAVEHRS